MDLEKAFSINISISFGGQPKKRKKKKMVDAYESFLTGNWEAMKRRQRQPSVSKTFGSLG